MKSKFFSVIGSNNLWLTLFFVIQLVYVVLSVTLPLQSDNDKANIDVVMRTATAVLVGYFISKNFIAKKPPEIPDIGEKTRHIFQTSIVAAIGIFSLCLMMIVRFVDSIVLSYTIMTQVRDFYLASVAFLMGTAE